MATIFRAVDTQLGRDVAIKLLRPEYLRDPDFSARFRQEAQAAASLTHPNIVTAYDYGEDPSGPYIVMELVDGEDLATILRRSGPLPPRAGRPDRRGRRPRARRGPRARPRPPRRQARQRPDRPRRPGQGRRLRHRPRDRRGPDDAARARRSDRSTTSARSRHAARPRRPRRTSIRWASSCTRCSPGSGRGRATAPRRWGWPGCPARSRTRSSVRASVPPDLAAITRKALALDPDDRFASAAAMADALDGAVSGAAVAAGAAGAGGGGPPAPVRVPRAPVPAGPAAWAWPAPRPSGRWP